MIFQELELEGGYLITLDKFEDFRGFNSRFFCDQEFADHGLNQHWKQINNTYNYKKGTLRGLHFQREPFAEIKLVRCISGIIWDVMVDIRRDSKTFGKYVQEEKDGVKHYAGGTLNLIHGSKQFLSKSTFQIRPEVGDFYFFPNYMMHTVYPFKDTDEERRSISFNAFVDQSIYDTF